MKYSENAANLKLKDYESFLACSLAQKPERETLFALFSFHQELVIAASASEQMVGKIKLQWWRDVLQEITEGKPARPHPALAELKNIPQHFKTLESVINEYEKLTNSWQPKTFTEISSFILSTIGNIFKVAANILASEYNENIALGYGYTMIAKKLKSNSKTYGKFASDPADLMLQLTTEALRILPQSRAGFAVITRHYAENLDRGRNFLILKLLFKGKGVL